MKKVTVQEFFSMLQGLELPIGQSSWTPHGQFIPAHNMIIDGPSALNLIDSLASEDLYQILDFYGDNDEGLAFDRSTSPIAWYRPYHFDKGTWGIFISSARLEAYGVRLHRALIGEGLLPADDAGLALALKLALVSVEAHEKYHHRIENMVSRQELLSEERLYPNDIFSRTSTIEVDQNALERLTELRNGLTERGGENFAIAHLEEALCNAHGASVKTLRQAKTELSDEILNVVAKVIHRLDEELSDGYQHGDKFGSDESFKLAESVLIEGYIRARKGTKGIGLRQTTLRPLPIPIAGLRRAIFINDGGVMGRALEQIYRFSKRVQEGLDEEVFRSLVMTFVEEQGWDDDVEQDLVIDPQFIPSLRLIARLKSSISGSVVRYCGKCLHDIGSVRGHQVKDKNGKGKPKKNESGQSAQRRYVEHKAKQAARLHAWHGGSPRLVILNVSRHDDDSAFKVFNR